MNTGNNGGNGGVGFTDAGVLALLADTARAGRGGYYGGEGGFYGGGPFANPSANAVRIDRNNQRVEDEARHNDTNRLCDRIADGFRAVGDQGTANEFRTSDRLRDLEREMQATAREQAKCCCDIKEQQLKDTALLSKQISDAENRLALQQCEDKAQIVAEVKAVESRGIERDLNAANAELTALKTQIACGCNCHPHHGGHGRRP